MNNKIPIETIININDPNIIWYPLSDEFKGYEYSNTGIMRSMKFFKAYPYGIQVKPDNNLNFELSNCFNQRKKIYYKDLPLDFNNPRNTINTNTFSRNPFITSKSRTMESNRKNQILNSNKETKMPHFTIIK